MDIIIDGGRFNKGGVYMFRTIKLYFSNRAYYEQYKRYIKRQKAVRKKLRKLAKEFCPWSGWYMNEMIKTMLHFYHKTYLAKDCCWSEESRLEEKATSLGVALHWADELDRIEDLEYNGCQMTKIVFYPFNYHHSLFPIILNHRIILQ